MKDIIDENSRNNRPDDFERFNYQNNNQNKNKSILDRVESEVINNNFKPLIKKKDDSYSKLPDTSVMNLNKLGPDTRSTKVLKIKSDSDSKNTNKYDVMTTSNASTNALSGDKNDRGENKENNTKNKFVFKTVSKI